MTRDNVDLVLLASNPDGPELVHPTTPHGSTVTALPVETIYHILSFLEPQDLIRIRVVSKFFRAIVQDPALWRTVYSTARLPLPPGPFPWQSVHFLRRALVHSARLAKTWTTRPLRRLSSKTYTGPRSIDNDRFLWVRGRWLIVSKDMKQLSSRDIETGSEHVLWDHGSFSHWGSTSVILPHGHFIYVAVHLEKGRLADPVKLLEFRVDDDTGHLSGPEMFDVPTWCLPREAFIPRIRVDSGTAPYAYVSLCPGNKPRHSLIFEPRRRRFYKFPRFRTRLDLLLNYRGAWLPHLIEVYFTRTHLFVLSRSYLIHGHVGGVEIVQTFALPEDDDPGDDDANLRPREVDSGPTDGTNSDRILPVRELRLTHEMFTRDMESVWLALIRDATVDHATRSTTLRFMHTLMPFHPSPDRPIRLVCTDYILPATTITTDSGDGNDDNERGSKNVDRDGSRNNHDRKDKENNNMNAIVRSSTPVLPITVLSHGIASVPGVWKGNLVNVSNDGFVRGFCMVGRFPVEDTQPTGPVYESDEVIHKFTVDATGKRCVAVVGDPSPPWAGLDPSRNYDYSMDGMRGKIWYTKGDVVEQDSAGQLVDREVRAIVDEFE